MSASMVATALLIFAAGAALDRRSLLQVPPASGSALGRRHFAARGFFEKKPLLGKASDADGPRWWWRPGTDLPAVDEVVVSHEAAISHEVHRRITRVSSAQRKLDDRRVPNLILT